MASRSTLFSVLAVTAFGIGSAGCSWGQAPQADAADDGVAAANAAEDSDTTDLDELFDGIDEEEPTPAAETADMAADQPVGDDAQAAADMDALLDEMHALRERVAAMRTEIEELKTELAAVRSATRSLAEVETMGDNLRGAMTTDTTLRTDVGSMLQGKVRLVNETGQSQILYINGNAWTVVEGESCIYAPIGTVAFQVASDAPPALKKIQEWRLNEQSGEMELEYQLGESDSATERSVLMKVPTR